jgi:hypothetical protein
MVRDAVEARSSKPRLADIRRHAKGGRPLVEAVLADGAAGMMGRPSLPKTSPRRAGAKVAEVITASGKHIAQQTGVSAAKQSRSLPAERHRTGEPIGR